MTNEARSKGIVQLLSVLGALSLVACSPDGPDNRPLPERLGAIETDLAIGSSGNDVRALHDYLDQYGYFPNSVLATRYPRWRPAVSPGPTDHGVFDERTADAVRALQLNAGQEPTGIVDAKLRALLTASRCGVPDNMVALDPSDKWAVETGGLFQPGTMYKPLSITLPVNFNMGQAAASAAVRGAEITWMRQTPLILEAPIAGPPIGSGFGMGFADLGPIPGTLGQWDGSQIVFNNRVAWSTTIPATGQDFETVVLHEMGHALGLDHSAFTGTAMYPFAPQIDRATHFDDNVGISAIWDTYWQLPGLAIDIAAGGDGSVWIVGTDNKPYKWNGVTWTQDNLLPRLAAHITVRPIGNPMVTATDNTIWQRTTSDPNTGTWTQITTGLALDIAVSNLDLWVVGTDHNVYRFNGTGFDGIGASAARISVTPTGKPWIVTTTNTVQSLTTNSPFTGTWQTVSGTAEDIGVGIGGSGNTRGDDGNVYKTDHGNLMVWNEQVGFTQSGTGAPSAATWRTAGFNRTSDPIEGDAAVMPANPIAVAAGPNGKPWVVGTNQRIYTTVR